MSFVYKFVADVTCVLQVVNQSLIEIQTEEIAYKSFEGRTCEWITRNFY